MFKSVNRFKHTLFAGKLKNILLVQAFLARVTQALKSRRIIMSDSRCFSKSFLRKQLTTSNNKSKVDDGQWFSI